MVYLPSYLHHIAELTSELNHRAQGLVVDGAQGLQQPLAAALINTRKRLGRDAVSVVLGVDDATARMGYGDFEAVALLQEGDVDVRIDQAGCHRASTQVDNLRAITSRVAHGLVVANKQDKPILDGDRLRRCAFHIHCDDIAVNQDGIGDCTGIDDWAWVEGGGRSGRHAAWIWHRGQLKQPRAAPAGLAGPGAAGAAGSNLPPGPSTHAAPGRGLVRALWHCVYGAGVAAG